MSEERQEEIERQRAVVKRKRGEIYDLIAEAVAHYEKEFPGWRVEGRYYGDRAYVELWDPATGRGKCVFY